MTIQLRCRQRTVRVGLRFLLLAICAGCASERLTPTRRLSPATVNDLELVWTVTVSHYVWEWLAFDPPSTISNLGIDGAANIVYVHRLMRTGLEYGQATGIDRYDIVSGRRVSTTPIPSRSTSRTPETYSPPPSYFDLERRRALLVRSGAGSADVMAIDLESGNARVLARGAGIMLPRGGRASAHEFVIVHTEGFAPVALEYLDLDHLSSLGRFSLPDGVKGGDLSIEGAIGDYVIGWAPDNTGRAARLFVLQRGSGALQVSNELEIAAGWLPYLSAIDAVKGRWYVCERPIASERSRLHVLQVPSLEEDGLYGLPEQWKLLDDLVIFPTAGLLAFRPWENDEDVFIVSADTGEVLKQISLRGLRGLFEGGWVLVADPEERYLGVFGMRSFALFGAQPCCPR